MPSAAAVAKALSAVDGATADDSGNGIVAKAAACVLLVFLLMSGALAGAKAEPAGAVLDGLPPWVGYGFLEECLEIQDDFGIYASVAIAQAQLEVGGTWDPAAGRLYPTASEEHNYFGIKAAGRGDRWRGEVTWDGTPGASGTYRKYADDRQCLRDRARMLMTMECYASVAATAHGRGTSAEQLMALSESPWCENGYTELEAIMRTYGLARLDSMTAADLAAPVGGGDAVARAKAMVGKADYVWGACDAPACQFDCSGFVSWCLTGRSERLGTTDTFAAWPKAIFPKPGDVAVFTGPQYPGGGHCGIYIGKGRDGTPLMIDCSDGVDVRPVDERMSYHRYRPG